ncbi:endonuclease/exonuclease/phosphatase family protein, partial [Mycobacterium kansasii]
MGSRHKRSLIKASLSRKDPDVVCLQETKVPSFSDKLLYSLWRPNDTKWLTLDAVGSSGGILVAWKSSKWILISSHS